MHCEHGSKLSAGLDEFYLSSGHRWDENRFPGLPSQSALLWDRLVLEIKRIARGKTKTTVSDQHARRRNPTATMHGMLGVTS